MSRPENPIDPTTPAAILGIANGLREARQKVGLNYRDMSKLANYSPTALSQAASGRALPSWELTRAYILACGESESEWKDRWDRAKQALQTPVPHPRSAIGNGVVIGSGGGRVLQPQMITHTGSSREFVYPSSEAAAASGRSRQFDAIATKEELASALRNLRHRAGMPSLRDLAIRTRKEGQEIPVTTIADALAGKRLPRREVISALSAVLDVTAAESVALLQAWTRLKAKDAEGTEPSSLYPLLHRLVRTPLFWQWAQRSTVAFLVLLAVLVYVLAR